MLATMGTVLLRFRYYRIVGRFHRLRRLIAAARALADRGTARPVHGGLDGQPARWARELRSRGFCIGPSLGSETVAALRRYAEERPCRRSDTGEAFLISEVREGRTPRGDPIAVADVEEPLACPDVAHIAQHPLVIETAARYLGYRPRRTQARLYWSPVSTLPAALRHAGGQTVDFHYDIDACNSFYVYFYLTGGGPSSGAHVVVEGSHGPKSLRMIFASTFQPEAAVVDRYGMDKVTTVAGGPGFGFFEDPACFHKALVPTAEPRLCLQFRYS